MFFLFLFLLAIAILLEGTIMTLPIVLISLLCFAVIVRDWRIFPLAFVSGFLLDVFAVRPLGTTSIFFLIFFFLILLYQRKYEITTVPFVAAASFAGTLLFIFIFGYKYAFLQAIVGTGMSVLFFSAMQLILQKKGAKA